MEKITFNQTVEVGNGEAYEVVAEINSLTLVSKRNIIDKLEMHLVIALNLNLYDFNELELILPLNSINESNLLSGFIDKLEEQVVNPYKTEMMKNLKEMALLKDAESNPLYFLDKLNQILRKEKVRVGLNLVNSLDGDKQVYAISYIFPEGNSISKKLESLKNQEIPIFEREDLCALPYCNEEERNWNE